MMDHRASDEIASTWAAHVCKDTEMCLGHLSGGAVLSYAARDCLLYAQQHIQECLDADTSNRALRDAKLAAE